MKRGQISDLAMRLIYAIPEKTSEPWFWQDKSLPGFRTKGSLQLLGYLNLALHSADLFCWQIKRKGFIEQTQHQKPIKTITMNHYHRNNQKQYIEKKHPFLVKQNAEIATLLEFLIAGNVTVKQEPG